ncbi:MAG: hypothetical protein PHQ60_10580 [Sideroxydans sp.]|nr:hypothetical protein [Sideroxydans sp.]
MPATIDSDNTHEVTLRRWRVIEAEAQDGTRTCHVWGHDVTNNRGRASTSIVEFNLDSMTATTVSGSKYKLVGLPGNSRLGQHAWINWCSKHGVVSEVDITDECLNVNQVSTVEFARINSVASHQGE